MWGSNDVRLVTIEPVVGLFFFVSGEELGVKTNLLLLI